MQRDNRRTGISNTSINDYRVNTSDANNPLSNEQRVEKLLGKEVMNRVLYEGTHDPNKPKDPKDPLGRKNREAFIAKLNEVLLNTKTDMTKAGKSPADDAIPLAKLLGNDGVQLYKKAIEEENKSREYRNAVFLKSTKHYEGKKWDKQLIMWVGGPSASGKSYGANVAVKTVGDSVMPKVRTDKMEGNDVVSIDGGVEREVSQMRQMVLQVAIKKGYPGIKDLHGNTELKVKSIVKEAAFEAKMNVVIPETFANPFGPSNLEKYDKIPNAVQVFSEVTPAAGMDNDFQMTVERMGNDRAWKSEYGAENSKDVAISFNNSNIGVESKEYEKQYFKWGKKGSMDERDEYMKKSKDKVYVGIVNDLIYVHKVYNKEEKKWEWEKCKEISDKGELKLSIRDFRNFQAWQEEQREKNKNKIPKDELEKKINNLKGWLDDNKGNLAKLQVTLDVRGKEFTEGKMVALETAVNSLYETSKSASSSTVGSPSSGAFESIKKGIGNKVSQFRGSRSSQASSEISTSDKKWQDVLEGFKPLIPEIMNSDESPEQKSKSLDKLSVLLDNAKRYDSGDSRIIKDGIAKIEKSLSASRDRLEGKSMLSSSSESEAEKSHSPSGKDDDSYLEFISDEYDMKELPRTAAVIKDEIETQMEVKEFDMKHANEWKNEINNLDCNKKDKNELLGLLKNYISKCMPLKPGNANVEHRSSSANIGMVLNGGKKPERTAPIPVEVTRQRRAGGEKPPEPVKQAVSAEARQNQAPKEEVTEEATRPSFRK